MIGPRTSLMLDVAAEVLTDLHDRGRVQVKIATADHQAFVDSIVARALAHVPPEHNPGQHPEAIQLGASPNPSSGEAVLLELGLGVLLSIFADLHEARGGHLRVVK